MSTIHKIDYVPRPDRGIKSGNDNAAKPKPTHPIDTETPLTTGPIDTFTVETLRNTLGEMQELYDKNRRGELQVKDESLLVELEFHIDQLADTLQALETEIKNKA
ncbi:MAG: hypothetical protein HYU97_03585 [Deltaproteobacteria bacterium]|nr:hypothetical protein [Deltaproteobacteria bacterium]